MRDGRELKLGKKYESISVDRTRLLMVHDVTEEDVGVYECVCDGDRVSLRLTLKGGRGFQHQRVLSEAAGACCTVMHAAHSRPQCMLVMVFNIFYHA